MTADTRRADALQLIFSFFLGLLLVVLVGAGVWTFYPQPYSQTTPEQQRLEELYNERESIDMKAQGSRTPAQQEQWEDLDKEIRALEKERNAKTSAWSINTSIILISFATVLMAISLFLPESLRVFSNGVLLGGLFTVLYGTGWSFAGGNSRARFFVMLVAVLLAVLFGYLRFVRGRRHEAAVVKPVDVASDSVAADDLASLTARVEALEARATAAAEALRGVER